ncbi:MAG: 30S ribosomal protein THX [Algoriphagus aquaeductus]|uniref:30S ribosomal protein S31 n=1 Tax=Algoriphagus aquaeductus TaxID=475299 RepID=A0A326RRM2_9BACT|nr:30S ribosomal protein THX [Algoriphagus aquaeductus]PZV83170.1 30S ribosomal protein S31 [Algoriphagus aquaeductus]
MGKGDLKSKKGKISRGTFGASRPRKKANKLARKIKLNQQKS